MMIADGGRKRIGLVLSGGGFRATLFYLGIIRFLRDAEILPTVTHIISVSGGRIIYWSLLDPSLDRRYECHWLWQRAAKP